jgi:hypothetical protein
MLKTKLKLLTSVNTYYNDPEFTLTVYFIN